MKTLIFSLGFIAIATACSTKPAAFDKPIDKEAVRVVIRKELRRIKECYENELKTDPSLAGRIVVQFQINDQGDVEKAKIKSSDMKSEKFESCVVDVIKSEKYPSPPPKTIAIIDYPFLFNKIK